MSNDPVLLTGAVGAVRILRLNRSHVLNALDHGLTHALRDALQLAHSDPSVRAVVLTGQGRAFCAGADRGEMPDLTPDKGVRVAERAEATRDVQALLMTGPKPVVAAVRGAAVGGGAALALACDMVVAGDDLRLSYPEFSNGLVPAIAMVNLRRQLGPKLAFELLSLGQPIDAGRALSLGLINRVVPPHDVEGAALAIAQAWADVPPQVMAATRDLFTRIADLSLADALDAGQQVNVAMRGFTRTA